MILDETFCGLVSVSRAHLQTNISRILVLEVRPHNAEAFVSSQGCDARAWPCIGRSMVADSLAKKTLCKSSACPESFVSGTGHDLHTFYSQPALRKELLKSLWLDHVHVLASLAAVVGTRGAGR